MMPCFLQVGGQAGWMSVAWAPGDTGTGHVQVDNSECSYCPTGPLNISIYSTVVKSNSSLSRGALILLRPSNGFMSQCYKINLKIVLPNALKLLS